MANLEAAANRCTQLFEQTKELWISLHEDPTMQKIEANIREKHRKFDEIRSTA